MTLQKLLLTFYPKSKTLFHMHTWEEPTNLFIDGWCRSSIDLYPLLLLLLPKSDPAIKIKLCMHAIVLLEDYRLNINQIKHVRLMYLGQEKYLFINLKMNQLTMIIETSHRSLILILGSSSSLSSNCFA
jgi:hypothetical protein